MDASGLPTERPFKATSAGRDSGSSAVLPSSLLAFPIPSSSTAGGENLPGSSSGVAAGGTPALLDGRGGGQQLGQPANHEVVLVVFIGGVTFSEISALRFLASRPGSRQR